MKAKAELLMNIEELQENERLGLNKDLKPVFEFRDIYFPMHAVQFAFITKDNKIKAQIAGQTFILMNQKGVWNKIKNYLNG